MAQNAPEVSVCDETEFPASDSSSETASSPSLIATGTTVSSTNTQVSTPPHFVLGPKVLSLRKLDDALLHKIEDDASNLPERNPADLTEASGNPYAHWTCAFGFRGHTDEPSPIPVEVPDFIKAVKTELVSIHNIQDGLASYIKAIHSEEYHVFDKEFLSSESTATTTTVAQLHQIASNLQHVLSEVQANHTSAEGELIDMKYGKAFCYAQPWIIRARAILVSAHVFYKINYVIGSTKRETRHANLNDI